MDRTSHFIYLFLLLVLHECTIICFFSLKSIKLSKLRDEFVTKPADQIASEFP